MERLRSFPPFFFSPDLPLTTFSFLFLPKSLGVDLAAQGFQMSDHKSSFCSTNAAGTPSSLFSSPFYLVFCPSFLAFDESFRVLASQIPETRGEVLPPLFPLSLIEPPSLKDQSPPFSDFRSWISPPVRPPLHLALSPYYGMLERDSKWPAGWWRAFFFSYAPVFSLYLTASHFFPHSVKRFFFF